MEQFTGRVAFAAEDAAGRPDAQSQDARSPYAVMADRLGDLVDDVVQADYVVGLATARRCEAIERARGWSEQLADATGAGSARSRELAERSFVAELAAALRVPERTAQSLIWTARTLVNDLPSTLAALAEGRLTYRHAQILVDQSYLLDGDAVSALEIAVLAAASRMTPSQFERKVRTTRERLSPETMTERRIKADTDRCISIVPDRDGMATLTAYLPGVQAVAIHSRLTEIARSLQTDNEARTLTQLRADVFSDLLLDADADDAVARAAGRNSSPTARYRSIRPRVLVTVPVLSLLRRRNEPGVLEGYGPIDPQTARELSAQVPTLQRILTHPETGAVLSIGRYRYRVPEDLKTWLRVRDGTCRFPSCSRAAAACDIDHTTDWARGGSTDHNNLAHLCPGHHTLKHASDWKVEQDAGGTGILNWTSPAGYQYTTTPETAVVVA
jgi:hypothetical protein